MKMPAAPAGAGIEREQTIRKQIFAVAAAAPEVRRGRSGRNIDEAAPAIDRHACPAVRAADIDILIRVLGPGVVAKIVRLGNRAKRPREFSRARVPSSHTGADNRIAVLP